MKRILSYVVFITLLLFSSCDVHEWPVKRETMPVHVSLNFHAEMGEQDFFYEGISSRSMSDAYDMRYVIRAYPISEDGTVSKDYDVEFIFANTDVELGGNYNYNTNVDLPEGVYRLIVWADFVDEGSTFHKYYNCENFSSIVLNGAHTGNTDYRDAFSGSADVTIVSCVEEEVEIQEIAVEMKRPLAKYTFISNDLGEFIEKELIRTRGESFDGEEEGSRVINLDDYKVVIFYPMYMPNTYNTFNDKAVNSASGVRFSSKITRVNDSEASLGFDYVVINDDPDAKVTVSIGLFDNKGEQLAMSDNFNIPLKRSVNTIVRGKFMVVEAGGGISIDPSFNGDHNIVLP